MATAMHIRDLVRRGPARAGTALPRRKPARPHPDFAGQVCSELSVDLPDEDLGEELDDCLTTYELGSKPRCEEVEYLGMVQDAIDRIARGE